MSPVRPIWARWPSQYGSTKADDAKRLKELEAQSARLKKLLTEAELGKSALKEIAEGTSDPEPAKQRRGDAPADDEEPLREFLRVFAGCAHLIWPHLER